MPTGFLVAAVLRPAPADGDFTAERERVTRGSLSETPKERDWKMDQNCNILEGAVDRTIEQRESPTRRRCPRASRRPPPDSLHR